jgi:hypothetical protein
VYTGNSKDSNIEFINIENMRKVLSIIYLIVLIVNGSYAQSSYPIYVSPALTPPYSLKLSDYSKFGSQQLVVNIAVNDLNVSNLPVKLHIKMETVGITIESLPTLNTTPIYLDGGAATILFGDDLADYFDINNLTFKGYSKEAYRRTGQLPEGFYKFTVEVLHFQTNRLISNSGTATAWISVGKPPVLKLPENGKELGEFKGMPIVFSWYASKLGNPMSAAGVQYKFEMWEMRVDGISPYTIAASVPLFHEETTSNTMVTVLPSSLLMEPGMKYAWRVTAMDVSGMVPFEQDGHSEMRVFTYKSKCNSVANLKADQHGRNGSFVWDPGSNHTSYNIELRKPATGWLSASETFDSKAEFYELDYATTYEMRVQAVCNGDPESVSDFSEWATLKIPAQRSKPDSSTCPTCGCSDSLGTGNIENLELRRDLKPGDTLSNRFGTTRFIVKSVEPQGDGVYKGHFLFWAELWKLKFVCEYWDLSVNTDNVILNMDYQSVYNPQFLLDVDATAAFLDSLAGAITDLTVSTTIKDTVTIGETISSIYVNAGDSVVAVTVGADGTVHEVVIQTDADDIPKTIIQGENGEQFVVTGNGQVMGLDEYKHTGGNGRKLDEYKKEKEAHLSTTQVAFSASQNQTYGFDAFSEEKQALKSKYPSLQNGYTPAYKSIASFKPDKVVASATESGITFRDEMGIPAIKSGNDLTVRGGTDGSVTALYAYKAVTDTTEEVAGKLNLMSFDEQAKKVYIVPVNGAAMPDATTLKEVLNKVYAQAVTRWEVVKIEKGVTLTFPDGQMTHGGSSAIDVYNTDQKSIISKFKEDGNRIESDALYLFFVANVKGKTGDIAGYMPLQKQVGFIYDNPNPHIIAHELGHGAFNLRHVFSPESFVAAQGTTKNLMDYSGSTDLWQHQWELIHDPESLWFAWAQDEKEGEGVSYIAEIDKIEFGNTIELEYSTFITPAGLPISFAKDDDIKVNADDFKTSTTFPVVNGCLVRFSRNGSVYRARYATNLSTKQNFFWGYFKNGTDEPYVDPLTKDQPLPYNVYVLGNNASLSACNIDVRDKSVYLGNLDQYKGDGILAASINLNPSVTKTETPVLSQSELETFIAATADKFNNSKYKILIDKTFFFHIQIDKGIEDDVEYLNEYINLEGKFKLYAKLTGKQIYVHIVKADGKIPDGELGSFAEKVRAKIDIPEKDNLIYLAIVVSPTTKEANIRYTLTEGVVNYSIYSSDGKASNYLNIGSLDSSIPKAILKVYTNIPKPYFLYSYFITYRGEVVEYPVQKSKEDLVGHSCIYDFVLGVDYRMERYITVLNDYQKNRNALVGINPINGEPYIKSTNPYARKYMENAADELANFDSKHPDKIVKTIAHGLLESALASSNLGSVSAVARQFTNWYRDDQFKYIERESYHREESPADELFVIGKNQVVYDQTLADIDALSLVLMPVGLDIVGDFAGAIYAGYYNDYSNAGMYAAMLAVPFGNAALVKELAKGTKKIARIGEEFRIVDNIAGGVVKTGENVLSRLNKSVIEDLNKLTPDTKTKILNDIAADANFEKFVNDNPVISKAFSAHKNDLTQLDLTQIDDLLKRSDIPAGAKSWATRGMTLRNMQVVSRQFDNGAALSRVNELYPNSYGRQITLKVTNKALAKDNVLEIVPDYLVRDGGRYKIVDAKYTSKAADDFELQKALTPNQDDVFGWIIDPKYKGKLEIEVRANNSKLTNLDLDQGEFISAENMGIEVFQSQAGNPNAIEKIIKLK